MHDTIHVKIDRWVVSFVTASASCLLWPILPPAYSLSATLICACLVIKIRFGEWLSGALFGVVWMASVGHWYTGWQLSDPQISQITHVSGEVTSIVGSSADPRFTLSVNEVVIGSHHLNLNLDAKIRLSWRQADMKVKQGMALLLAVKLKPPHGLANQGGFDYQQWLRSSGIVATGYVKSDVNNRVLQSEISLRQRLADQFQQSGLPYAGWIAALAIGHRGELEQSDWQLIQQSGIAHLVAISGLHLSIVAGVGWVLLTLFTRLVCCAFAINQTHNLRQYSWCAVVILVSYYSFIAGFSLPTVRALIMFSLVCALHLFEQHWRASRVLIYCVLMVIVVQPMSLLSSSFWLSFCAVSSILFYLWRFAQRSIAPNRHVLLRWWYRVQQMVGLQVVIMVLMLPLSFYLFHFFSFTTLWINLIAIPIVTLVFVPLCLLCVSIMIFDPQKASQLLALLNGLFDWGIAGIHVLLQDGFKNASISLVAVSFAIGSLVLSSLFPLKYRCAVLLLGWLPWISCLLPSRQDNWQVNVLDVGQGLSVVIVRNNRAVVYDVGGRYPSGFNMADAAVLPFLARHNIHSVDYLVLSHFDNDHAGASPFLIDGTQVRQVVTTDSWCKQGWVTPWQGLTISSLWPDDSPATNRNDHSCVLRIEDANVRLLLPGDISHNIEQRLVTTATREINADILVAPHHGSRTSSSSEFIDAVDPQWVVFSQGYKNRWSFPSQEVVTRYVKKGVKMYATSESGQIQFTIRFSSKEQVDLDLAEYMSIKTRRNDLKPFWYSR